jgi:hypothetical protein
VVLGSDEEGMRLQRKFEHLHDRKFGMPAGEPKSAGIELFNVLRLDLKPVTESFADEGTVAM